MKSSIQDIFPKIVLHIANLPTLTLAFSLKISSTGDNSETLTKETPDLQTATWQHLAVTWDASASLATFYFNGESLGTRTGTLTAIHDNASIFHIATMENSGGSKANFYDGKMDDVRVWGDIPKFDFTPLDHLDLGKKLDIIDFEKGAKVAASQFYFLKKDAVLLEYALMHFAFDILNEEGFELLQTPDLAKISVIAGTGFQPKGP